MIAAVIPPSVAPWSRCDPRRLAAVAGVLTDIDDTLTTDGAMPMGVVAALAALREAGLQVIAVTGRPMGWSLAVARDAPLAGVVAENGGVFLVAEHQVGEPCAVGGVAHPGQLPLTAVRIVREAILAVAEPRVFPVCM